MQRISGSSFDLNRTKPGCGVKPERELGCLEVEPRCHTVVTPRLNGMGSKVAESNNRGGLALTLACQTRFGIWISACKT